MVQRGRSRPSLRPAKGSAATILAHLADNEVVYAYRLRLILGTSGVTIQAINQDAWAETFDYGKHDPAASLEDFRVNRERTLRMLKKLSKQQWECYGMHTERGRETVRRRVELMAGHNVKSPAPASHGPREVNNASRLKHLR